MKGAIIGWHKTKKKLPFSIKRLLNDKEMRKIMSSQIVAVVIFVTMFAVIISGKVERHIPALIGAACTLVLVFGLCMHSMDAVVETLNVKSIFNPEFWYAPGSHEESSTGINWSTIIFFLGMMIMVEGMGMSGFFRWLCLKLAKLVDYKVIPLFVSFMFLSAFLAMFIDSITVILFMAAITVELAGILKFNPVYMILPEIFCSNIGGAATMSGDPPNIIVGTSLGLTFMDFVKNTGLLVWISMIAIILYFYFCFGKKLKENKESVVVTEALNPKYAIADVPRFIESTIVFLIVVVLLVTHAQTGLTVAAIGVIAAVATFIIFVRNNKVILSRVDWNTVLFFVGLFIVVGGLEQTGILTILADFIGVISGGNAMVMIAVILWVSAFASALVDNIPFAATMVPVIKMLSASQGIDIQTLAWTLSLGTDIGGNATPIGASANVVGTSIAEKNGHHISWGTYLKYAVPATVLELAICTVYLFVRYL